MFSLPSKNNRVLSVAFYIVFTVLNLVQAYNTGLIDDEAYYWIYSRFPAWGYYDHPPMIALMIKAGYAIFHNELGVRLFMVTVATGSILLLEKIVSPSNKKLFYAIILNFAVLNFAGFIAVPDIPLLFFVTLFLYCYKRLLNENSLKNAIIWGISMALMLYTKYHGILVIGFTVLSNPSLFKRKHIYIAAASGIALFLPQLYWQYAHGFPSVYYHLWDRNSRPYEFNFTSEYLLGQLALAGPLFGWLFISVCIIKKPIDKLEKALKYIAAGIYLFFFLSSLNGRIEANWTIPAISCLSILSYNYFENRKRWHIVFYTSAIITFFALLALRIILFFNLTPINIPIFKEARNNKEWVNSIRIAAKGRPIVFLNSYQLPSKYWFYSGDTCYVINTPSYRQNNFNIWQVNNNGNGKNVCLVSTHPLDSNIAGISTPRDSFYLKNDDSLGYCSNLLLYLQRKVEVNPGDADILLNGNFYGTDKVYIDKKNIFLCVYREGKNIVHLSCTAISTAGNKCNINFEKPTDILIPGKYTALVSFSTSVKNIETLNSNTITLIVR